jgi:hypothetical protein
MALPDAALEGDKEAFGTPGSNSTLYVRDGNRLELPALGSVIVEELLKLPAGHLAADHPLADLDDLVFVALGLRLPPLGWWEARA